MLFPIAGFLMFFVPAAGFLAAIVLCCVRRWRFLAPFAFLVPLLASYGALAGFFTAGIGLERLRVPERITGIGALFGFLIGGILGGVAGLGGGLAVSRAVRWLKARR